MSTGYIAVGYACNQRCRFCPCSKEEIAYPKMCLDDLKRTVDFMVESQNINSIVISGGEPTMHSDFIDIVKYITEKNMIITILTNSERFFNEEFCDKFSEVVDKEKTIIVTTIHSQNKEEHEWVNQTSGSFFRTTEGLKNLINRGVSVTIKHCITKLNYKDLTKFYEFIDTEFDQRAAIQFCSIDYCGLTEAEIDSQMLDFPSLEPYFEEMFDKYIEDIEKGSKRNVYCINMPLCSCDPYYWQFFVMKSDGYKGYASPDDMGRSEVSEDIENNVGTFGDECKECIVNEICPGTYKTAFDYYGSKIIKKYSE